MNQQSIQNQYTIHSRKLLKTLPIVGSLTLTSPPPFLAHPRPPPSYWNRHASQSCHSIGFVATPPNGVNRQGMSPAWFEQGRLIWVFPKIGVPQNGWFIMENPTKWMIWGIPIFGNTHLHCQYVIAVGFGRLFAGFSRFVFFLGGKGG